MNIEVKKTSFGHSIKIYIEDRVFKIRAFASKNIIGFSYCISAELTNDSVILLSKQEEQELISIIKAHTSDFNEILMIENR